MSNIDEYIEKVRKATEGFSEEEMIRYIYIDLGKRLSFNLDFFLGNGKTKIQIYRQSKRQTIGEALESNIIICKDSSYILEYVLRKLGVNIVTVVDPNDYRKCAHVYNIVKPKDGKGNYILDLQVDLENIQAHMRTTEFGKSEAKWKPDVISRDEIEKIDFKIGYVTKQDYYADEYIDNLRLGAGLFDKFEERIQFVLENIDIYDTKNMGYAERVKHHETVLGHIFTQHELLKVRQIDCYRDENNRRKHISGLIVDTPPNTADIYMFSATDNQYKKIPVEELAKQVEDGLVIVGVMPSVLKHFYKRKKAEQER